MPLGNAFSEILEARSLKRWSEVTDTAGVHKPLSLESLQKPLINKPLTM
jgi:hypothetical protein